MRILARWKLRTKLVVAFAFVVLLGTVSGLWNLANFRWAATAFQVASRENLPALDHVVEADRDMQKALVAERTLMFARQASEEASAMRKEHADVLAHIEARWARYKAIPAAAEERKFAPEFEAAFAEWEKLTREVVQLLAQDDRDARKDAIDLSLSDGTAKFEKARGVLKRVAEQRLNTANAYADAVQASATRTTGVTVVVLLVLIASSAAVGLLLSGQIVRALKRVVERAEQAATGDLTGRIECTSGDELGHMGQALNEMLDRLEVLMTRVQQASLHTASAAQQLAAGSQQISSGAQEQASSLEQTAASLEQITGTVRQNAENARQANQLAAASRSVAEEGGHVVREAVSSMDEISRASKKIAEIITAIDEIAFQTNLLALNAAVEAARAGQQGRGFAVVASEVRNLAQRSATAAKQIKALIEDSVQKVAAGSELVNRSGETLKDIVSSVKRVTDIIAEIAAASQEQTTGIDQVNRAVTQMDQVVQSNGAHTEELSSTAQSLAGHAQQLQALVARFKLAGPAGPATVRRAEVTAPTPTDAARATARRLERPSSEPHPRQSRRTDVPVLAATPATNGKAHHADDGFEEF